jgi:hypothetical protein
MHASRPIFSALGDDVVFELRHLPAEEPATLPPSSRARCRFRRHSRRCCCLEGVQHRRLLLHTPASLPPTRPVPDRGLVRAEHPPPRSGADANSGSSLRLRRLSVPSPSPSPPSSCTTAPAAPTPPRLAGLRRSRPRVLEVTSHSSTPAPPSAPCRRRRVQHSALPVSCACRGGRLVRRYEAATNGTAEPRDGRSPSGGVPERTL